MPILEIFALNAGEDAGSAARTQINLGGPVARNDDRIQAVAEPPPPPPRVGREATRTTTVRIRESLHLRLKYYCLDHDTSLQGLLEAYLTELLKDTPER